MSRSNSYWTGGIVLSVVVLAAIVFVYLTTEPVDTAASVTPQGGATAGVDGNAPDVPEQVVKAVVDAAGESTGASDENSGEPAQPVSDRTAEDSAAKTVVDEAAAAAELARQNAEQAANLLAAELAAQKAADDAATKAQAAAAASEQVAAKAQAAAARAAADETRIAIEKAAEAAQKAADDAARKARAAAEAAAAELAAAEARAEAAKAAEDARIAAAAKALEDAQAAAEQAANATETTTELASVVATEDPVGDVATVAVPEADPNRVVTAIQAPSFDLVRVAPDGGSVIAGRAEPNVTVEITADGNVIGSATANARGEFVALLTPPASEQPLSLGLIALSDAGVRTASVANVLILSNTRIEPAADGDIQEAPIIVRETPERIEIVQPAALPVPEQVVIDAIGYDREGAVEISGRGRPTFLVRLYMNGRFVEQATVNEQGAWAMVLSDVVAGRYTLRVDEVDSEGKVASRAETPFQRIYPDLLPDIGDAATSRFTVQPGNNLWTIAKNRYGDGLDYWQIFRANKDLIRDPDLIYPGQIFALPE